MVEVIKANSQRKRTACMHCSAVLEYDEKDEYPIRRYDDVMKLDIHSYYIICPSCRQPTKTGELAFDRL